MNENQLYDKIMTSLKLVLCGDIWSFACPLKSRDSSVG